MSNLLQTVIPAAVTFLVGYQGAFIRTSRLRKSIRADTDMLDALPDGHPSRATLAAHVEQLIDWHRLPEVLEPHCWRLSEHPDR